MLTLLFVPILAGCALLCFSMPRHFVMLFGSRPSTLQSYALRAGGYLALLGGAALSSQTMGWGAGLASFAGLLTIAVLCVALSVTCLDRNT